VNSFVQRGCRAEPNDLLRFASAPLPSLLAALQAGFVGMGSPESVQVKLSNDGHEFIISDLIYGFEFHTLVMVGQKTADAVRRRELRRLPMLVGKFLKELELGRKIFVFKGMVALDEEVVFALASLWTGYFAVRVTGRRTASSRHCRKAFARVPGRLSRTLRARGPGG
jgi:hypothetical protein